MRMLALAAVAFVLAMCPSAHAAFVVDDPGEAHDANPGDGSCKTAGNVCTLVAAIDEANVHAGPDVIQLPPGTWTYDTTLPTVTTDVTIQPTTGSDPTATIIQSASPGHPRLFVVDTATGNLTLDALTLEDAGAPGGSALEITDGSATLSNCIVKDNTQTAITVSSSTGNGTLTLAGCVFSNNTSTVNAGALEVAFANLVATNTTFDSNSGTVGALYIHGSVAYAQSFTGCTFTNNSSTQQGGAMYITSSTTTIDACTFTGNTTPHNLYGGGAIYAAGAPTIITNSTFSDNHATNADPGGGNGGAIFVLNQAKCTGCTFYNNTATGNGGAVFAGANDGAEFDAVDSTFSGNSAVGGGAIGTGGGSETSRLASVTITNNTATGSHASGGGGGGTNGSVHARNTIIAGNQSPLGGADCDGVLVSDGYDLLGDDTNCTVTSSTGDQVGTGANPIDAGLDVLFDNGGPTLTHALLATSPAGEAGDPTGCTDLAGGALTVDQRGQPRTVDGDSDGTPRCDIGAFEAPFGTFPTPTTTSSSTTTSTSSSSSTSTSTSTAPPTTTTTSTSSTTTSSSTTSSSTTSTSSTTHKPTTTAAPTTTTTLAAGCAAVPDGPTFASIVCRLQTLLDRVQAESRLVPFQSKLAATLTSGHDEAVQANGFCGSSDAKHAKQRLKQVGKRVTQYAHRLNGLPARKKLDPMVRADFLAPATPLGNDVKSLRGSLHCPADAAAP